MAYTMTPKEKYAEAHAQARIDLDAAFEKQKAAERRKNFLRRDLGDAKTRKRLSTTTAHTGHERLIEDREAIIARESEPWINSLLHGDPALPSASLLVALGLRDDQVNQALSELIDRAGADEGAGWICDEAPEVTALDIERLKADFAEASQDVEDARAEAKQAGRIFEEFELGQARVA